MKKNEAYDIVYNDLMKCNLFTGKYDAKNGNDSFMYGVATVMEVIAGRAQSGHLEEFDDIFFSNMADSEKKAESDDR